MANFLASAGNAMRGIAQNPGVRNVLSAAYGPQVDAIKTARLQQRAAEQALDTRDLQNQAAQIEIGRMGQLDSARAGVFNSDGSYNPAGFAAYATIDPQEAFQIRSQFEAMDDRQRAEAAAQAKAQTEEIGRVAVWVKGQQDPAAAWASVYPRLPEEVRADLPPDYNPDAVDFLLAQTMEMDDLIDQMATQRQGNAIRSALGGGQQQAPQPAGPQGFSGVRTVAPEGFTIDPNGAGSFAELFPQVEQQFRLPPGYLNRTAQIESGMNPNAKNPNSSAEGLFQFIDGTASQYGLTNKRDPRASTIAAGQLAADNADYLRQVLGREPTASELYLAHQQGAGGAAKLLANPNARAADVVGADAVRLNGGRPDMTAGEFAGIWQAKFDGGAAPQQPQMGGGQDIGSALATLVEAGVDQGTIDIIMSRLEGPKPQSAEGKLQADIQAGLAPAPMAGPSYRPATPEEAAQYGAAAGQINIETGQFQAINAPSGMSLEMGPDGVTRLTQGPGAGTGKPFTEGQSKDNVYAVRAQGALATLDGNGEQPGIAGALASRWGRATDTIPLGLGRDMQPAEYQLAQQAGNEFLQAILRKDTGAAITEPEQEMYGRTYLPQPGDSTEVMAQKAQSRRRALEALKAGMSPDQILAQERGLDASGSGTLGPVGEPQANSNLRRVIEIDGYTIEALD